MAEPTPEQKKQIRKLYTKMFLKSMLRGLKYGTIYIVAAVIITAINVFYVKNDQFAFLGILFSGILVFHNMFEENRAEHDKTKEEARKILES